jgi:hypothetical protein
MMALRNGDPNLLQVSRLHRDHKCGQCSDHRNLSRLPRTSHNEHEEMASAADIWPHFVALEELPWMTGAESTEGG